MTPTLEVLTIGRISVDLYAQEIGVPLAEARTFAKPIGGSPTNVAVAAALLDGDAFLIPRGYHGPCVAAPGYPLYYLNVMAGPNPERTIAIVDDPAYGWIRATWDEMPTDPRCPMTTAAELA